MTHGEFKKLLTDLGITQVEVAQHIGIAASRMNDIFQNKPFCKGYRHRGKIARYLGRTVAELFGNGDQKQRRPPRRSAQKKTQRRRPQTGYVSQERRA